MTKADIKRYFQNIQDEVDSAYLYHFAESVEGDQSRADYFRETAGSEERHARFWMEKLRSGGIEPGQGKPGARARIIAFASRLLGKKLILEVLAGWEKEGIKNYKQQPEAVESGIAEEEVPHGKFLNEILGASLEKSSAGSILPREKWHKSGGNSLRAAVLGANDGLVSNLSLIMGVAGANLPAKSILITGIAGLLAGGASMAIGEWLSVQSAREMYERQVRLEKEEIENNPEEETDELKSIYEAKGLSSEDARRAAESIMSGPKSSLDTLVREELGLDPEELGGSPLAAAGTSLLLFSAGAIFPLFPYFFLSGAPAVAVSVTSSTIALFIIGLVVSLFTGKSIVFSGGRQVALGIISALITFFIGKFIGIAARP